MSGSSAFVVLSFFIFLPREPLGVIILEGCTVELAEEETEVFFAKLMVVQSLNFRPFDACPQQLLKYMVSDPFLT